MEEWERASEKGRIERCAESFQRLAEVFQYLPSQKEELSGDDLEEIYDTVRSRVCRTCGKYAQCWEKNEERTARLVYDLLTAVAEDGEESGDCPAAEERFARYCVKGYSFAQELRGSFCQARINLMWSNRMLENRAAVARQLSETAQIIQEIACTVYEADDADSELEHKVKAKLRLQNVRVQNLRIVKNSWGPPEVVLTAKTPRRHCVSVKAIADTLSKVCGRPLVPERNSRLTLGAEPATLHFVEETGYYMLTGSAMRTCAGQTACGDNFSVLTGSHGQVILGISDGMGSGVRANRESQTVIELLEQFMGAGFTAETAVRMINSAMVLQRGMQRFSTLDICGINLYSGQCEFLKIGAATTFIRRAGWVETVTSTSLPVGVFQEVDFERSRKRLEHGDLIVMVSDGVLDALPQEEQEELMKYLILKINSDNPAEFAELLMEQALSFTDGDAKDDMTILAGGFWKK